MNDEHPRHVAHFVAEVLGDALALASESPAA
jgi:hypothetical protein